MKWIGIFILLTLVCSGTMYAQAIMPYSTTATQTNGSAIPNATVTVCLHVQPPTSPCTGTLATLYLNSAHMALTNPFLGDSQGNVNFWAAPNVTYDISIAAPGLPTYTYTYTIGTLSAQPSDAIQYVSTNGNDSNDGLSMGTAKLTGLGACSALPASGGYIYFAAGSYTVASIFSCGSSTKPVTMWFNSSAFLKPSTASTNVFQFEPGNKIYALSVDVSGQTAYSGNPIQNDASVGIQNVAMYGASVVMASDATGPCWTFTDSSNTYLIYSTFDLSCKPGTASHGVVINSAGTSFFSNNVMSLRVNDTVQSPKYCLELLASSSGGVGSNTFNLECEENHLASATAGIHLNSSVVGNNMGSNVFNTAIADENNQAVIIDSGNVCGNYFVGSLGNNTGTAVTDNTNCAQGNEWHDTVYSTAHVAGGFSTQLKVKSSAYALTASDSWINVTGTTTITVPHLLTGQRWDVFNSGAGTVTIQPDSGTINGAANITIAANVGKSVTCDGTNCFAH